jgi:hypothetical protein
MYAVAAAFGAMSLLTMTARGQIVGMVIIASSVVTWIGVHQLGYAEFGEIQRALRYGVGNQRRVMGNNIHLAALGQRLGELPHPTSLRATLIETVSRLEFHRLEFEFQRPTAELQEAFPPWSAEGAEERNQPSSQWRIPIEHDGRLVATIVITRSLQKQIDFDPAYLLHALKAGFGPRLSAVVANPATPAFPMAGGVTLGRLDA